jgi:uncharacterized protein YdeI (YjbR/CyaY-like superfamily)
MYASTPMPAFDVAEILAFTGAAQWEAWLANHHTLRAGVWLKIARKHSGVASITPEEMLDVALCYGWIDGQRRSHDATYFLQKCVPRRPKSLWSKVNIAKVEALIAAGRMRAPGFAAIAAARADGRWEAAYESQKNATIPADLATALADSAQASRFFESLGKSDQYAVIVRLLRARTPEQRARQLRTMVGLLEAGQKVQ